MVVFAFNDSFYRLCNLFCFNEADRRAALNPEIAGRSEGCQIQARLLARATKIMKLRIIGF